MSVKMVFPYHLYNHLSYCYSPPIYLSLDKPTHLPNHEVPINSLMKPHSIPSTPPQHTTTTSRLLHQVKLTHSIPTSPIPHHHHPHHHHVAESAAHASTLRQIA